MGVSENSVPLNPMVLLIIIPIKWLFHWEYTLFSDKPIWENDNEITRILGVKKFQSTRAPPRKIGSSLPRWPGAILSDQKSVAFTEKFLSKKWWDMTGSSKNASNLV